MIIGRNQLQLHHIDDLSPSLDGRGLSGACPVYLPPPHDKTSPRSLIAGLSCANSDS